MLPDFYDGWNLPWGFYFYKLRSLKPWIFYFSGFSSIYHSGILEVYCSLLMHTMSWWYYNIFSAPHPLDKYSLGFLFIPSFGGASTNTKYHWLHYLVWNHVTIALPWQRSSISHPWIYLAFEFYLLIIEVFQWCLLDNPATFHCGLFSTNIHPFFCTLIWL